MLVEGLTGCKKAGYGVANQCISLADGSGRKIHGLGKLGRTAMQIDQVNPKLVRIVAHRDALRGFGKGQVVHMD